MKLRDMMFLVIGGLLVISGMVLNALLSGDAEAQEGLNNGHFDKVICKNIYIVDGSVFDFKVNKYPLALIMANARRIGNSIK